MRPPPLNSHRQKVLLQHPPSLFALAENYPELKADTNFRELQKELSDTESKIAFARQFYNDTVKSTMFARGFPANLIAGRFVSSQNRSSR